MASPNEGDRFEQVLERLREEATRSVPPPLEGFGGIEQRRLRRRRHQAMLGAAAVVAVVALGGALGWWAWHGAGRTATRSVAAAPAPVRGGPGASTMLPELQPLEDSVMYVAEANAQVRRLGERVFALDVGTVWFSVEPGSGRLEIRTPDRTVVVLGTVFVVRVERRGPGARTSVGVLVGRVRVEPRGGVAFVLAAGEEDAGAPAPAVQPLDEAWRAKLTALFPERVASAGPFSAAPAGVASPSGSSSAAGGAVRGPGDTAPSEDRLIMPPPPAGETATGPGGAVLPAESRPSAPGGAHGARPASSSGATADATSPTLPIPPPETTWNDRYDAAVARLGSGDAAGAAKELQALIDAAPSPAAAELATLDLGRCYRRLGDLDQAGRVYREYLQRYPDGRLREDARFGLCNVIAARGDADAERACLHEYLDEFPHGSMADSVRRRLGMP